MHRPKLDEILTEYEDRKFEKQEIRGTEEKQSKITGCTELMHKESGIKIKLS